MSVVNEITYSTSSFQPTGNTTVLLSVLCGTVEEAKELKRQFIKNNKSVRRRKNTVIKVVYNGGLVE